MKVFISWSGEASQRVAELLRVYVPCMLQDVVPFMSQHDLGSGVRWSQELATQLEEASFGIICLTPENMTSAWLLFEAGALTKHVNGRACCLLLRNLRPIDVNGPLAQFQNAAFAVTDVRKLIGDLNNLLPRPLPSASLDMVFEKWWPDMQHDVNAALSTVAQGSHISRRSTSEVLEELVERIRSLRQRLDEPLQRDHLAYNRARGQAIVDRVLLRTTREQLSLLGEFLTIDGQQRPRTRLELADQYDRADIDALERLGLVAESEQGRIVVPEQMAKYIAEYLLSE